MEKSLRIKKQKWFDIKVYTKEEWPQLNQDLIDAMDDAIREKMEYEIRKKIENQEGR